jgi:hypothetical protein
MRVALFVVFAVLFSAVPSVAQAPDYRVLYLVSRILEKVPDAPYTREALGNTEERESRASNHAVAIVNAADRYKEEWMDFVEKAGWKWFDPQHDLPALIAAVAFHESSFRSVVRLDDNTITKKIPKKGRADMGVLQVRAPSEIATNCGVETRADTQRLIDDLDFAYMVGTCILTKRVSAYLNKYRSPAFTRLHRTERSDYDLLFFGVAGKRKGTEAALRARELLVIERYNWGDSDLYLHTLHGGYARRIITLFEYFRAPTPQNGGVKEFVNVYEMR